MNWAFWISLFLILFAYAGYPGLVALLSRIKPCPVRKGSNNLFVSILISAYNEEDVIARTIENKLVLDYPKDRFEIIVVSDGSNDQTNNIVERYSDRNVRLLVQPCREGKTAALNRAAREAKGDILVFSDANSMYEKSALQALVSNFHDEKVGYVTGKMVYVDSSGSMVGSGCSAYMRYENALRQWETRLGSVVGVDGGIDAIRKSLYEPMRPDLLPDLVLPLKALEKGFRVVYEREALLMESTLTEVADELKMRIRVILRSFHALWYMRRLLNPALYGVYSFQLMVHKVLRYIIGLLQVSVFITNGFLLSSGDVYVVLLGAQILFYTLALGGYLMDRIKAGGGVFSYAYYFCLLNGASMIAFWKFIRGENQVTWQPRKGN